MVIVRWHHRGEPGVHEADVEAAKMIEQAMDQFRLVKQGQENVAAPEQLDNIERSLAVRVVDADESGDTRILAADLPVELGHAKHQRSVTWSRSGSGALTRFLDGPAAVRQGFDIRQAIHVFGHDERLGAEKLGMMPTP
jgi:hypothetical protein